MVRKDGSGRKRPPGGGGPAGRTKMDIIVLLSDGKKTRQEILDFARSKLRIREARGIDRHLKALQIEGLIIREEERRGFDVTFQLNDSFSGFKRLFTCAVEKGRALELLASPYGQGMINTTLLDGVSGDVLYCSEYSFIKLLSLEREEMEEDPSYRMLVEMVNDPKFAYLKGLVDLLRDTDRREVIGEPPMVDPDSEEYLQWREQKIDEIVERDVTSFFERGKHSAPFINSFRRVFFPDDEVEDTIDILKCSPSAVFSLVSLRNTEGNVVTRALALGLFPYLKDLMDVSAMTAEDEVRGAMELEARLDQLMQEPTSRRGRPTSTMQLLRAMLIADILNGNVVANEWVEGYINDLMGIGQ
jgi:DNA-binding transcriptional ArsR family regulator